jgi:hypothetical protein
MSSFAAGHDPGMPDSGPRWIKSSRSFSNSNFDIQALYNKRMHQVTIHATITDSTPRAVAAITADADSGPAASTQADGTPGPVFRIWHKHLCCGPGTQIMDLKCSARCSDRDPGRRARHHAACLRRRCHRRLR